jgi:hypothetical protein
MSDFSVPIMVLQEIQKKYLKLASTAVCDGWRKMLQKKHLSPTVDSDTRRRHAGGDDGGAHSVGVAGRIGQHACWCAKLAESRAWCCRL